MTLKIKTEEIYICDTCGKNISEGEKEGFMNYYVPYCSIQFYRVTQSEIERLDFCSRKCFEKWEEAEEKAIMKVRLKKRGEKTH